MSEPTELERQQSVHIKELETMLESCEAELQRTKDELERAKQRIKELMEVWQ